MSVEIGHSEPQRGLRVPAPPTPERVDPTVRDELFRFRDLSEYTPKQRAVVRGADRAFHSLISSGTRTSVLI